MSYWLVKATLGTTLRVVWRPRTVGLEHVPKTGAAIIASNHLSFSDSFFMPTMIPGRKVTFLAKSDYFTGRGIKGRFNRWFFSAVGSVPVDRSGGRASEAAVRTGTRILGEGELLGIYPEGTRSPDGKLYRGKTGVARMAIEAGVPVIPCAMVGTDRLQPPGQVLPRLVRPEIRFGEPLDFSRYAGMGTDRAVLRAVTDEIMQAIMKLSGQEYVDIYASKAKAQLAAASEPQSGAGEEPEAVGD